MRFVWAVVAFVLATLLIGAGIAQRTIFLGPSAQQIEVAVAEPATYTLIDGEVMRTYPGMQSLIVRGDGEVFVAYGRTADLQAWLADAAYSEVSLGATPGTVAVSRHAQDPDTPATGRNPAGSDLWLDSFSEPEQLITEMQLPEGMSVLIASDGTAPAPSDIVISWPLDTSTPLAGPLIAAGSALLLVGLVLYGFAIRYQRRGRGPRRKGPGPLPPTQPIDLELDSAGEREAITETPSAPSAAPGPRRRFLAVPALAVSALLIAGCSADSWPQLTPSPSPSPTATVVAPENQKPPAVTQAQASRILQSISATLATADADRDIDLAATRLDGAALEARRTDYALRGAIPERVSPAVIPTESIEVLLPQAVSDWPRTVLVLSKSTSDETVPPVILTMTQEDPWSTYKVTYMAEMQASAEVPKLAPAWLGTTVITEGASAFLALPPGGLAEAFADVVDAGEASSWYRQFDAVSLELAQSIRDSRQVVAQALVDNGAAETSQAAFDIAPGASAPLGLATLDSGAIVALTLVDSETITPTSADAVIRFGENQQAKVLTGAEESAQGVVTTYGLQLFFSVPAQGSTEQIRLLAVHQDILNVEVIK